MAQMRDGMPNHASVSRKGNVNVSYILSRLRLGYHLVDSLSARLQLLERLCAVRLAFLLDFDPARP